MRAIGIAKYSHLIAVLLPFAAQFAVFSKRPLV
jgi:hypothetical protein